MTESISFSPELEQELDARLQRAFGKRLRLVAENQKGQCSGTWMFWGNRSDYYFGAKSVLGAFKVSLHENGLGYVAFHKPYLETKNAEGIVLPSKTILEWKLPVPSDVGAVHAASLILPADFCRCQPLSQRERANTLIFGIKDGCAAEIGLFLSREDHATLEARLIPLGHPIIMVTLENGLKVSVVARSRDFDPSVLPTTEQTKRATMTTLQRQQDIQNTENLNAMIWNKPEDGGTLQIIEIGGVRLEHRPPTNIL